MRAVHARAGRRRRAPGRPSTGTARPGRPTAGSRCPNEFLPAVGLHAAGDQHDEAGQVLVLGAQAVGDPGAHAGPAGPRRAGVEQQLGGGVVELVGVHRPDHAQLVGDLVQVRHARRTSTCRSCRAGELARRAEQLGRPGGEREPLPLEELVGAGLAVVLDQLRLVVEQVEVRRRAGHVQVDHPLGLAARTAAAWALSGLAIRSRGGSPAGAVLGEHRRQGDRPEAQPELSLRKCRRVKCRSRSCLGCIAYLLRVGAPSPDGPSAKALARITASSCISSRFRSTLATTVQAASSATSVPRGSRPSGSVAIGARPSPGRCANAARSASCEPDQPVKLLVARAAGQQAEAEAISGPSRRPSSPPRPPCVGASACAAST